MNGEIPGYVEYVLYLVKEKTGIDWRRKGLTKSFLKEVEEMKREGILKALETAHWASDRFQRIISHFTVPEGYFFRYNKQFEFLKNKILPELLKNYKEINIGSIGSGRGEEAYSIAMLLEGKIPEWWTVRIIGLDLNKEYVERAKSGVFLKSSLREWMKDKSVLTYMEECKDGYFRVKEHIRKKVEFYPFNIMEPPKEYINFFHILFFRNVLIYIAKEKLEKVVENAASMLQEEGIIFFGHTDIMPDMKLPLEEVDRSLFIYRKHLPKAKPPEGVKEKVQEETEKKPERPPSAGKIREGFIHFNRGELKEAEEVFRDVLREDPFNQVAKAGLAFIALERGMLDGALSHLDDHLLILNPLPEVYYLKGLISINTGKFDRACEFLSKAVELAGHLPQIRVAKALVHLHLSEPDKAAFELEMAEKFLTEDLEFSTFLPAGGLKTLKTYINDLKEML